MVEPAEEAPRGGTYRDVVFGHRAELATTRNASKWRIPEKSFLPAAALQWETKKFEMG